MIDDPQIVQTDPQTIAFIHLTIPRGEIQPPPVAPTGRVQAGQILAARVARTVYHGPCEGLGEAWGEFTAWIEAE